MDTVFKTKIHEILLFTFVLSVVSVINRHFPIRYNKHML